MRLIPLLVGLWAGIVSAQVRVNHSHGLHVFPDGIVAPTIVGPTTVTGDLTVSGIVKGQLRDAGGQWQNVRAYGAVGTCAIDDRPAIQTAIDTGGAGATIFFPEGCYLISTPPLLFDNDQVFRGVGSNEAFGGAAGSVIKLVDGSGSGRAIFQARTQGTTRTDRPKWYDLQLIVDQPSDIGVDLAHVNYARIDGLEIRGTASSSEADQIGVHIASNSPTTVSGGIGNRILHSEFFNLDRPIVIEKEQANVNVVFDTHINGNAVGKIAIAVRGLCTGGGCNGGNSCEVDGDCSCGGVCAENGVGGTKVGPVGTRIINNVIEDNTTLLLDVGRRTLVEDNYFEETNSPSAVQVILSGSHTLYRGNVHSGAVGQSIKCVQIRGATTPNRPTAGIIEENNLRNCFVGIDSVAGSTGMMIGRNTYVSNTTPLTPDSAIFVDDPVNMSFTQASLPALVDGSRIRCSNCTASPGCLSGGSGAVADRYNGSWFCDGGQGNGSLFLDVAATSFNNTAAEQTLSSTTITTPANGTRIRAIGTARCTNTSGTNSSFQVKIYVGGTSSPGTGTVVSQTPAAVTCNTASTIHRPVLLDAIVATPGASGILSGEQLLSGTSNAVVLSFSADLSSNPTIKITGQLANADPNIAITNDGFRVEATP